MFSFILHLRITLSRKLENVAIFDKYNSASEVGSVKKENISYFMKFWRLPNLRECKWRTLVVLVSL